MRTARNFCFTRLTLVGTAILMLALVTPVARAGLPALLREAFLNSMPEEDHWSRLETTKTSVTTKNGTEIKETIVLVDPSKPYPEQFIPKLVDGHAPTSKDIRQYRKKGEERGDDLTRWEQAGTERASGTADGQDGIAAELDRYFDVDHISTSSESATDITYLLPGRSEANARGLGPDCFDLFVRVDKQDKFIFAVSARPNALTGTPPFASGGAANIAIWLARVDSRYGPVQVCRISDTDVRLFAVLGQGHTVVLNSNFRRVTPYRDRLQSSIGPLKVLGF